MTIPVLESSKSKTKFWEEIIKEFKSKHELKAVVNRIHLIDNSYEQIQASAEILVYHLDDIIGSVSWVFHKMEVIFTYPKMLQL